MKEDVMTNHFAVSHGVATVRVVSCSGVYLEVRDTEVDAVLWNLTIPAPPPADVKAVEKAVKVQHQKAAEARTVKAAKAVETR